MLTHFNYFNYKRNENKNLGKFSCTITISFNLMIMLYDLVKRVLISPYRLFWDI